MKDKNSQDKSITVVSLNFASSEPPVFKQGRGEKFAKLGKDDKWAEYLLGLYKTSSKHRAIINNKTKYIYGNGLEMDVEGDPKAEDFNQSVKKWGKKAVKDTELFGSFYLEIIPSQYEGVFGTYHISWKNIRSNDDNTIFYYKKNWADFSETPKEYPAFNRNLKVPSIFMFKEYDPDGDIYGLPGYLASCNYIEADAEVSKHTLNNAKTGFSGSKFINFYNGTPTEDEKRDIVNRFIGNNTGPEGKKVILGFNNAGTQAPTIEDLGASDLTKEDFSHVNDLIAKEIYAGAEITNSALFGIPPGDHSLGGNAGAELRMAFDIFKNTYANDKQLQFEEVVNFFAGLKGITAKYTLKDIDPIGFEFSEATMLAVAPHSWLMKKMGIEPDEQDVAPNAAITKAITGLSPLVANKVLESMTVDEIRSLAGLMPKVGGDQIAGLDPTKAVTPKTPEELANETPVNEHVKNLSAKQNQQLIRVIRDYGKGRITKEMATILLRSGLGFTDAEISSMLGEDKPQDFSSDHDNMELLFDSHGECKEVFEILKSKPATFDSEDDDFIQSATFDRETERQQTKLKPPVSTNKPPVKIKMPEFMIRYSYEVRDGEGPELLQTSRPFCVKMCSMNKFYSRQDIQTISGILGYNVFERVGGFWNDGGIIKKHCRHEWKANIVVKK